jgi:hypothetical protein
MSAVRLQLLGPPWAWHDEQPLAFKTRKTLALLDDARPAALSGAAVG